MGSVNVNIRMDSELKRQFETFCADMGLTMTAAVNVFAKKAVRENRIPFEIGRETPNAETLAAIKEVQEMKNNPKMGKSYTDIDEMMRELLD